MCRKSFVITELAWERAEPETSFRRAEYVSGLGSEVLRTSKGDPEVETDKQG